MCARGAAMYACLGRWAREGVHMSLSIFVCVQVCVQRYGQVCVFCACHAFGNASSARSIGSLVAKQCKSVEGRSTCFQLWQCGSACVKFLWVPISQLFPASRRRLFPGCGGGAPGVSWHCNPLCGLIAQGPKSCPAWKPLDRSAGFGADGHCGAATHGDSAVQDPAARTGLVAVDGCCPKEGSSQLWRKVVAFGIIMEACSVAAAPFDGSNF